jgi:hypothetical protein
MNPSANTEFERMYFRPGVLATAISIGIVT